MKALAAISGYLGIFMLLVAALFYASQFPADSPTWNKVIWISFIVLGCGFLVTWTILSWNKVLAGFQSRSTVFGVNMVFVIVVVIGIIVVLNLMSAQRHLRGDYTKTGRNTLDAATKDYLKTINNDIQMTYFFAEGIGDARNATERLLSNFQYINDHIKYRFVDAEKEPGIAGELLESKRYPCLVIQNGDRKENIQPSAPDMPFDEESVVNGIVKVTRTGTATVYFTQGHGEVDLAQAPNLKSNIERDGYKVDSITLSQYLDIPDASAIVVTLVPNRDFYTQEIDTLKRFIDKGGRYLVAMTPDFSDAGSNNSLLQLLAGYGVDATNSVLIDPPEGGLPDGVLQMLGISANTPILATIDQNSPVTKKFAEIGGQVPARNALAMKKEDTAPAGVTVTELIQSSARGWGETDIAGLMNGQARKDDRDLTGPVAMAVSITKTNEGGRESRIVALGDLNAVLRPDTSSLFFNAINWLGDQGDLITVARKDPNFNPLDLSQGEKYFVYGTAFFGIPIFALGIGIIVWSLRRTAAS